jgi:hypothetical protein
MTTCKGFTVCGKKCKKTVRYGDLCFNHVHTEVPDRKQFNFYQPDVGWPDMCAVQSHVKKFNNGKLMNDYICYSQLDNRSCMIISELFFRNFFLDFNTPHWQKIITDIQEYLKNYPFMSKYREVFRKKFDTAYRLETQKKCAEIVFASSILGIDIAKKISTV